MELLGQCLDGFHGELSFWKGRVLFPRSCWPFRFTARLGFVCNSGIWIAAQGSEDVGRCLDHGGSGVAAPRQKEVAQGGLVYCHCEMQDKGLAMLSRSKCTASVHIDRESSRVQIRGIPDYMTQRLQEPCTSAICCLQPGGNPESPDQLSKLR